MQKKAVISRVMATKISHISKIKKIGMFHLLHKSLMHLCEKRRSQNNLEKDQTAPAKRLEKNEVSSVCCLGNYKSIDVPSTEP
jgi:hypothetical protein